MQDNNIRVNAPKDPQKIRSFFYVMTDTIVSGNDFGDGAINDKIFLDNNVLVKKAEDFGGITDKRILELLGSCEGFHKLVHSIGITLESDQVEQVMFELRMYGRKERFESGTRLRVACNCDGSEQILSMQDYKVTEEDVVPGFFDFGFKEAGQTVKASIRFYLNDGYTAPVVSIDPSVDFQSESYGKMIEKSLLHMGNVKRIQDAVQRAERGEEITIAYIGGSITEGAGAKPSNKKCYAYKSFSAFRELCGESRKVNYIKAGVGGTPSEFGMVRYERDVLKENTVNPDIVVVEFAVNDADDETEGNCFESLVYRILSAPNHPAVVLLFSVFVNDWNLQDRLAPIGFQYDLPMVSVKDAVVEQFSKDREHGNVITK
ncbi:MAG TPA: SGNH/GDSL hydrolase family protein, partial [Lachnospiraceae bacterium]|nr:SGNH/GDSL hydrolase family protein [Lachnospiraceae bacterium]